MRSSTSLGVLAAAAAVTLAGCGGHAPTAAGDGDLAGHAGHADHAGHGGHAFGAPGDPGPDPAAQAAAPLGVVQVSVGAAPHALALAGGSLWVADRDAGTLTPLDPTTLERRGEPVVVGGEPVVAVAADDGTIWVADLAGNAAVPVDGTTGAVGAPVPVGKRPSGVAVAGHGSGGNAGGSGEHGSIVWTANGADGTVTRIDPSTGVTTTSARVGFGLTAVAQHDGRLWVAATLDRQVVPLDATTLLPAGPAVDVDAGATAIVATDDGIWVTASSAGTVTRIDPTTGAADAPVIVDALTGPGAGPSAVAASSGALWVANSHDRTVVRVDPTDGTVAPPEFFARAVSPSLAMGAVLADTGTVWVSDPVAGTVTRL